MPIDYFNSQNILDMHLEIFHPFTILGYLKETQHNKIQFDKKRLIQCNKKNVVWSGHYNEPIHPSVLLQRHGSIVHVHFGFLALQMTFFVKVANAFKHMISGCLKS